MTQAWLSELAFIPRGGTFAVNRPLDGRAVAILGNGPSLTPLVARTLEAYPHILTNNSYLLTRTRTVLVALDRRWFEWHGQPVAGIGHKVVTALAPGQTVNFHGDLYPFEKNREDPLNLAPGVLSGKNSGHSAIMLALQMGATRIYLAGFDMGFVDGRAHWHPEHPVPSSEANYTTRFRPDLELLAKSMSSRGIVIAAVTPSMAQIPHVPLEEAVKDLAG
jgi:hypothetical protein